MIGTKQLYEIFIEKEKESINSINKEIIKLNNTKKNLVRKLESYKAFINRFTDCNFDELLELTEIPTIKTTVVKNLVNNVGITDFKHQLSVIIGCNIRIRDLNDYIGTIENKILPYQAFSHVIKQGNLLYIEQLLKGNKLSLGTNLGEINIRGVKRKNLRPDWGSSNKNKKELMVVDNCPSCNKERRIKLRASKKNEICPKCFHNLPSTILAKQNQNPVKSEKTRQRMKDNHWVTKGMSSPFKGCLQTEEAKELSRKAAINQMNSYTEEEKLNRNIN